MKVDDIPQVMEIEREAFPDQWPPPSYKGELKNHLARYYVLIESDKPPEERLTEVSTDSRSNGAFHLDLRKVASRVWSFLACRDSDGKKPSPGEPRIVGAAGFWLMVDEVHITTIAVRGSHRGRGLGELLLIHAVDLATELKAQLVTLEVRVSNEVAQKLYEKYGFNKVGVRKGYYSDNGEDALIMTTERISSASFQTRFNTLKRELSRKLRQDISLARTCESLRS